MRSVDRTSWRSRLSLFWLPVFMVFAFPTLADQTLWFGYHYFGTDYQGGAGEKYLSVGGTSPAPKSKTVQKNSSVECLACEPVGMRISDWGTADSGSHVASYTKVSWLQTSDKSIVITNANDSPSNLYVAQRFDYISYKLSYSSAIGGTMPSTTVQTYETKTVLPAPTTSPEGYDFVGWHDKDGVSFSAGQTITGASFGQLATVHEDGTTVSLTADWSVRSYSINVLSSGNGSVGKNPESESYTYGSIVKLSATPDPGHSFKQWNDGSTANPRQVTVTGNATYTASFSANTYSISVSSSGHGSVGKNPESGPYAYGSTVTLSAAADEGYSFKQWNDGSTVNPRQVIVTGNAAYTASFSAKSYTMTFNPNGGSCSEASRQVVYGSYIGPLPSASQPKKVLSGWHLDPAVDSPVLATDKYNWTTDVTLHAHWKDADLFEVAAVISPTNTAGMVTGTGKAFEAGQVATLTAIANSGYSFKCWQDGNTSPTTNFTVLGNVNLTAVFTGNVYTVRFQVEEGCEEAGIECPKEVKKTYGQPFGELPEPTVGNPDWVFDYWATEDGNQITSETIFLMNSKYNFLYAHAVLRPVYTIAYDPNGTGVTGSMPNQKAYRDAGVQLQTNDFKRSKYRFLGWTNTVGTLYSDCQIVTNLAAEGATATLYAKWEAWTLNEAMHYNGTNAWYLTAGQAEGLNSWTIEIGSGIGYETDSCVRQTDEAPIKQCRLTAVFQEAGTLSFRWKPMESTGKLVVKFDNGMVTNLYGIAGEWNAASVSIPNEPDDIDIMLYFNSDTYQGYVDIDQMTWTPGSVHPEPTEKDAAVISSASVVDGRFVLSFAGTNVFDYVLRTNADLQVKSWGEMMRTNGENTVTFEPPILPGLPQLFYKVETIQKK